VGPPDTDLERRPETRPELGEEAIGRFRGSQARSGSTGFNAQKSLSLWGAEYHVRVVDGVWTNWVRFASTPAEKVPDTYEVVEVRSRLSG